ncbi:hypothetical protein JCM14467A_25860 [Vulcanisaeta sp. JCM 14467]
MGLKTRSLVMVVLIMGMLSLLLLFLINVKTLNAGYHNTPDPNALFNYTASIEFFRGLGARIIIVGSTSLYNNVYSRALRLNLSSSVTYMGSDLNGSLRLLSECPGSILIIDLGYVKPNCESLGSYLSYGVIVLYNASVTTLQSCTTEALIQYYRLTHRSSYTESLLLIPYYRIGPSFIAEVITAYGGKRIQISVAYSGLSLRGLTYLVYIQASNDPALQLTDPCSTNLINEGYYESPTFNDIANPYSDNNVTYYYYDFCMWYPTQWQSTVSPRGHIIFYPGAWMYVQPALEDSAINSPQNSMVSNPGMGIAIDAASSYEYYYKPGEDTFFYGPIASAPGSITVTSSSNYDYLLQLAGTATEIINIIVELAAASDPVSIIESTIQVPNSAIAMNDTYAFNPQNLAFGYAFQYGVDDQMNMYLPSLETISAYLPVDENLTLVSTEYTVSGGAGYYVCQNYAYYAIQVLWDATFVWGNPSSLNFQVGPTTAPGYTYSGPLSTGQSCIYYIGVPS